MTTLLIAEHDGEHLSDQTAKALTAARALGGDVHVLCAGARASAAAEEAAQLSGIAKVLLAECEVLAHWLAEPFAAIVVKLGSNYDAIVAPSTARMKNVMPRVAAHFDVMQISDVLAVHSDDTFERAIYAGNAIQVVRSRDRIKVLTVRSTAFAATGIGEAAPIETIEAGIASDLSRFVDESLGEGGRPELTSAKIVVAGGRALGSKEKFETVILPLADKLGAAIGASRAAVDAGYAPNDWQVGQTGKIVAPQLYIACGISGAIQHLAGMKDSKIIIAINKDEDAPIFQVADYALVGDIFEFLPEMTKKL